MGKKEWKWFGNAGHLIVSSRCRFHLCTQVGKYLVSTVGEWIPNHKAGASEASENEYLKSHPLGEEVGCGRLFETMVFVAGKPCDSKGCNCGIPEIDGSELECIGYNDRKSANIGHRTMCKKYESRQSQKKK